MKQLLLVLLAAAAVACSSVSAFPQLPTNTKVNPTEVIFPPSPKHNDLLPSGAAVLTKYTLRFYEGTSLVKSFDIGKPTPVTIAGQPGPMIQQPLSAALVGLQNNKVYTLDVLTTGPGGTEVSAAPSNPFVWEVAGLPGVVPNAPLVR